MLGINRFRLLLRLLPLHGNGSDVIAFAAGHLQGRIHQGRHGILHGGVAQALQQNMLLQHIPQAIRTQQQAIVLLQLVGPGKIQHRPGLGPQAGVEHIAIQNLVRQLQGPGPVHLSVGVIARARLQHTIARPVQARIATVHPADMPILNHRRHHRGAGPVAHAFVAAVSQDALVRQHHPLLQKRLHIRQARGGLALKLGRQGLQRQLRGHLAFGVPAHAIGQHKQPRLSGVAVAHAVFIGGPTAPTA